MTRNLKTKASRPRQAKGQAPARKKQKARIIEYIDDALPPDVAEERHDREFAKAFDQTGQSDQTGGPQPVPRPDSVQKIKDSNEYSEDYTENRFAI